MKKLLLSLLLVLTASSAQLLAQSDAAEVKVYVEPAEFKVGDKVKVVVEVSPRSEWYVYSILPSDNDAYVPTTMGFELTSRGFDSEGKMEEKGNMSQEYDEIMEGTLRYFKSPVTFSQEITITEPEVAVIGYLDYMGCNGFKCVLFTQDIKLALRANE